jgi:BolA protein
LTDRKKPLSRAQRIEICIKDAFAPVAFALLDESHLHAGHAGAAPEGETHFRLKLSSARFAGLSRVARHRLVLDALAGEFASGLHALALELKSPEEQ